MVRNGSGSGSRTGRCWRSARTLHYLHHARASTVYVLQGRTTDNVIAVTKTKHPHLTTQKNFSVEINRTLHCTELVTNDTGALRERLKAAAREWVSALEETGTETKKPTIQHKADLHGRRGELCRDYRLRGSTNGKRSGRPATSNKSNTNLICGPNEHDGIVQRYQTKSEKLLIGSRN